MDTYYVFMVYHKKGKYKVKEFESEDELEDFIKLYLNKYRQYAKLGIYESLYNMINESIKVGMIVIDEKKGYGIVKVVHGNQIEDDSGSEDYYSSSSLSNGEDEE